MPDSNRPFLFQRPEEPPPGLEAIRAWLRKPRPWLRGVVGWIRLPLSVLADAWDFTKRNAKPGAAWVRRVVEAAKPAVQVAAKAGQGIRKIGVRASAAAAAFRDPDGKRGETEAKIRKAGGDAQRFGGRITALANLGETALSVLGGLAGMFQPDPPTQVKLRDSEEPDDVPDDAPTPDGRLLPRPPPKRLPESVSNEVSPAPAPHRNTPDADRDDEPGEAPSEPSGARAVPDDAAAEQAPTPSSHQPAPVPDPMPSARPQTDRQPPSADRAPEAAPNPVPDDNPEDRLEGLPRVLHRPVLALGDRPLREVLYPLILDICRMREWTTAKQLAGWLSMHQRSLVHRHLGPMVDDGLLELQSREARARRIARVGRNSRPRTEDR